MNGRWNTSIARNLWYDEENINDQEKRFSCPLPSLKRIHSGYLMYLIKYIIHFIMWRILNDIAHEREDDKQTDRMPKWAKCAFYQLCQCMQSEATHILFKLIQCLVAKKKRTMCEEDIYYYGMWNLFCNNWYI